MLADEWNVAADVWSATSWNELRRDAVEADEANLLHPEAEQRVPYVTPKLPGADGPFVAVSDWMRSVPDQIARWVPGDYSRSAPTASASPTPGARPRRFFHIDAAVDRGRGAARARRQRRGQAGDAAAGDRPYKLTDITAAGAGNTGGDS